MSADNICVDKGVKKEHKHRRKNSFELGMNFPWNSSAIARILSHKFESLRAHSAKLSFWQVYTNCHYLFFSDACITENDDTQIFTSHIGQTCVRSVIW